MDRKLTQPPLISPPQSVIQPRLAQLLPGLSFLQPCVTLLLAGVPLLLTCVALVLPGVAKLFSGVPELLAVVASAAVLACQPKVRLLANVAVGPDEDVPDLANVLARVSDLQSGIVSAPTRFRARFPVRNLELISFSSPSIRSVRPTLLRLLRSPPRLRPSLLDPPSSAARL